MTAREIVNNEIYHNIGITAEKELKENPDLLFGAKNYYPMDEDGKRDEDGEYPDIMEFWAVSEWLGRQLEARGEIVFEMLDFVVWGRQATGQAIYMDEVIEDIVGER